MLQTSDCYKYGDILRNKKYFLKEDRVRNFLIFVILNKGKEVRLCHWKK